MPLGAVVMGTPYEDPVNLDPKLDDRLAAMDKPGPRYPGAQQQRLRWYEIKDRSLARAV